MNLKMTQFNFKRVRSGENGISGCQNKGRGRFTIVHGPNESQNYILRIKRKLRSCLIQSLHCADKKIK